MHKNRPTASLELAAENGKIYVEKLASVYEREHMPVGTVHPDSPSYNRRKVEAWLNERAIPKERSGLQRIIDSYGLPHPNLLLLDSLGISLSDQYWLKPADSNVTWGEVNFFENRFSEDLGEILLGNCGDIRDKVFRSPDATSSGNLPKKWQISNNRRILMKGGKRPYFQEPENETVASHVMEFIGVSHVEYDLTAVRGKTYSLCETFVNRDTDFVSAHYVEDMSADIPSDESKRLDFFLVWCEKRGITGVRPFLDRMITVDFMLCNTDRHLNNFGMLMDAETLEWIGPAPLFDTGNSLWNEIPTEHVRPGETGECKPFRNDFHDQLALVSDFSWLDPLKLKALPDEIAGLFRTHGILDPGRIERIRDCLSWRVGFLEYAIADPAFLRRKPRHRRRPGSLP
jgi:hypothetical protein